MKLTALDDTSPKTPLQAQKSRKNLFRKPSYSLFCFKFRCHGNGGRSGENAIAFDGTFPKTLYARKNLAKISYASRVIIYFVPNLVAIATGVGWEKMQLAAFDGPFLKTRL